jgi:hypothetical protein
MGLHGLLQGQLYLLWSFNKMTVGMQDAKCSGSLVYKTSSEKEMKMEERKNGRKEERNEEESDKVKKRKIRSLC